MNNFEKKNIYIYVMKERERDKIEADLNCVYGLHIIHIKL